MLNIRILDSTNFEAAYSDTPPAEFVGGSGNDDRPPEKTKSKASLKQPSQMKLLK
jgi:hypothetical protein